ncbi:MAG TPA: hypothetical protein C5S37_11610 [Methanophagales archaeon]|nr:hypothetical protein [Methanophagales archaeon]
MDTIESEEKIVWSNGMIAIAEKHGFGNLGTIIAWISEKRPLFFFGVAGAVFTVIGLILGANVLYIANMGRGVAVGSALM